MTPTDSMRSRSMTLISYWGPAVLWMTLMFWMSTAAFSSTHTSRIIEPLLRYLFPALTQHEISWHHDVIRKMAHGFEYFILGLLLFRAFRAGSDMPAAVRWAAYSFLVLVLFALSDEFHQSFTTERTASLVDVGIDSAGGFVALCLCILLTRSRRPHRA